MRGWRASTDALLAGHVCVFVTVARGVSAAGHASRRALLARQCGAARVRLAWAERRPSPVCCACCVRAQGQGMSMSTRLMWTSWVNNGKPTSTATTTLSNSHRIMGRGTMAFPWSYTEVRRGLDLK